MKFRLVTLSQFDQISGQNLESPQSGFQRPDFTLKAVDEDRVSFAKIRRANFAQSVSALRCAA
jgi:hypothetical protein